MAAADAVLNFLIKNINCSSWKTLQYFQPRTDFSRERERQKLLLEIIIIRFLIRKPDFIKPSQKKEYINYFENIT